MFSLLKNRLYRMHLWLDNRESLKFILMLMSVGVPNLLMFFGSNKNVASVGIILFLLVVIFSLTRINYISGKLKFNRSTYNPPSIGEQINITKTFWYDGSFRKSFNPCDPSQKPSTIRIPAGAILMVEDVIESDADWEITVLFNSVGSINSIAQTHRISMKYFESRSCWKTKSDIRNDILERIGI